ncbi:MAG TPA: trans-aconitate 2-methyltransferase [Thermopolyspora sp.]|jgi:Trans-aconitate methyltransferase
MSRDTWNPAVYARYAGERSRPFFDLTARIHATDPHYVVDLGCGSGELTAELARRWPSATVHGIDSSPAMIGRSQGMSRVRGDASLVFEIADVRAWHPAAPVDVIVSNAVLHWLPEHRDLLPRWIDALNPGGWLAVQMPGNFDAPSHALIRELCRTTWRDELGDLAPGTPVGPPEEYVELLAGLGCRVDAWETTYVHMLQGQDAVFAWVSGTTLRPMLDRLPAGRHPEFVADCRRLLGAAYPAKPYGTPFAFRRVFAVAQRV